MDCNHGLWLRSSPRLGHGRRPTILSHIVSRVHALLHPPPVATTVDGATAAPATATAERRAVTAVVDQGGGSFTVYAFVDSAEVTVDKARRRGKAVGVRMSEAVAVVKSKAVRFVRGADIEDEMRLRGEGGRALTPMVDGKKGTIRDYSAADPGTLYPLITRWLVAYVASLRTGAKPKRRRFVSVLRWPAAYVGAARGGATRGVASDRAN